MIEQLKNHITEEQLAIVLTTIKEQYKKYLQLTGSSDFTSIFADEYAPHKRQHSVSWAISSAFPSGTSIGDSLKIERLLYGKGHTRPILFNDLIELHILNRTTHFNADYLKQRYEYNAADFSNQKLFAFIKFSVEHRKLVSVSLCLPDKNGNVVAEEPLLGREMLKLMAA